MPYPFLSPEWIAAVDEIRADFPQQEGSPPVVVAANVTITDPPFGDTAIEGHVDTTGPTLMIAEGHLSQPEFSLELPYALAKQFFVDRDVSQIMPAIFAGQIRVGGDSSKLLELGTAITPPSDPDELATLKEIVARIDAITADLA